MQARRGEQTARDRGAWLRDRRERPAETGRSASAQPAAAATAGRDLAPPPLEGITIVEAAYFIAGTLASAVLAELGAREEAARIRDAMCDQGVLLATSGPLDNLIKIRPPLVFSRENADLLLQNLELAFSSL